MFGTKKFLLLLLAVVLMAASIDASIDASVAYAGERQLSAKKGGSVKSSKKSAHNKSGPTAKGEPSAKGEASAPVSPPNAPGAVPVPAVPVSVPAPTVLVPPPNAPGGIMPPPNAPGGVVPVAPPTHMMQGSKKSGKKGYGKGKGGKGSKKSSKKDSSSSSSSSSDDTPSQPVSAPTGAPGNITAAPTSTDSFAVRPAPFALYYTFERVTVNNPSIEDFNELAEVTREFLNTFFTEKYAQTSIIILDDFLTFLTRSDASVRPTLGVFRSVARFNPRSIFYPPRSEIESEIKLAFTEPASQLKYLKMLSDKLPNDNPFKGVASITYGEPNTVTTSTRVSSFATASIAAAAAGVVILVAGIALLGKKRGSDGDDESGESFPHAKKKSTGSVAGETCAGTTWRSSAVEIVNVEDLQDEPLDDDSVQRQQGLKLNEHY